MPIPSLYKLLKNALSIIGTLQDTQTETCQFAFIKTKEPGITAQVEGRWLNSRRKPMAEVQSRIEQLGSVADHSPILCLGFGLGYEAVALRARYPENPLIIITPYHPYLCDLMENKEKFTAVLQAPMSNTQLYIFPAGIPEKEFKNYIRDILSEYSNSKPLTLVNPGFLIYGEDHAKMTHKVIQNIQSRKQVNAATIKRFSRLWVRNSIQNLSLYRSATRIADLQGIFSGLPAILVAAGPSLDLYLEDMPTLAKRNLIIAVDTAMPALQRIGVYPDFLVLVDPQYWNTRHLDFTSLKNTIVVSEISSHPRGLRDCPLLVLTGSLLPIGANFEKNLEGFHRLGAGGSVATTAWDLIRFFGVHQITLAGLDLGFPEMQTHLLGSLSEEIMIHTGSRLSPTETNAYSFLGSGSPEVVRDHNQKPLLSDKRMDIYASWFEHQIESAQKNENLTIYRLGNQGRNLGTFPSVTPQELSKAAIIREKLDIQLDGLKATIRQGGNSQQLSNREAGVKSFVKEIWENSEQLLALTTRAARLIQAYTGSNTSTLIDELDSIDTQILKLSHTRVVGLLMDELLDEISNQTPAEDFSESLVRSRKLYEGFKTSASWLLDLLKHLSI